MHLINTSFHAGRNIADSVINDVRSLLMPMMNRSTVFSDIVMAEILVEVDPDCKSFTLQVTASDLNKALDWFKSEGQEFFNELHKRYGQNVVYFTTPMRIIK